MKSVRRASTHILVAAGALLFAAGCGDDDAVLAPPVADQLLITGGNNQTIPVSTVSTPLEVTVHDQYDDAIAAVTVTWVVVSGSGTLASATSVTNAEGKATVVFTAGTTAGDGRGDRNSQRRLNSSVHVDCAITTAPFPARIERTGTASRDKGSPL